MAITWRPAVVATLLLLWVQQLCAQHEVLLYRMLGNSFMPRHDSETQVYDTLKIILEHEPKLPGLETKWLVNRIVDEEVQNAIINLLNDHHQQYSVIPFEVSEYRELTTRHEYCDVFQGLQECVPPEVEPDELHSFDFWQEPLSTQLETVMSMNVHRVLYTCNVNAGRNYMIGDAAASGAHWVLPWDGNTIMTVYGWNAIQSALEHEGLTSKYFVVPRYNLDVLAGHPPQWVDTARLHTPPHTEPQVVFRIDAAETFNDDVPYGPFVNVELYWRLGIPGKWDQKPYMMYDPFPTRYHPKVSEDVGGKAPASVGWSVRLTVGQEQGMDEVILDAYNPLNKGMIRAFGIASLLGEADYKTANFYLGHAPARMLTWNETVLLEERKQYRKNKNKALTALIDEHLVPCADAAVNHGPWSVVDKLRAPPSKDKRDYFTSRPYAWPNPSTRDGLPYVHRDGHRAPGTVIHDPYSDWYDRSRLADFIGNTTCLALASFFKEDKSYADLAGRNLLHWFVNKGTAMNPHLNFAQVFWGHNGNSGMNFGVIETRDMFYLLDVARLTRRMRGLELDQVRAIKEWFKEFQKWLKKSKMARREFVGRNNHGTYFDAQVAGIAAFLNDTDTFMFHTELAKGRMLAQFTTDGSMPEELKRVTQLHYMVFGLQAWTDLARLGQNLGVDLWNYAKSGMTESYMSLAFKQTLPFFNATWSHRQESPEMVQRMLPMYYMAKQRLPALAEQTPSPRFELPENHYFARPVYEPLDGIQPYWNLGLTIPPKVSKTTGGGTGVLAKKGEPGEGGVIPQEVEKEGSGPSLADLGLTAQQVVRHTYSHVLKIEYVEGAENPNQFAARYDFLDALWNPEVKLDGMLANGKRDWRNPGDKPPSCDDPVGEGYLTKEEVVAFTFEKVLGIKFEPGMENPNQFEGRYTWLADFLYDDKVPLKQGLSGKKDWYKEGEVVPTSFTGAQGNPSGAKASTGIGSLFDKAVKNRKAGWLNSLTGRG